MIASLELNGSYRLKLVPQGEVEKVFLKAMAELSEKGATTVLAQPEAEGDEYALEVARR
jgi:hypothetical protein